MFLSKQHLLLIQTETNQSPNTNSLILCCRVLTPRLWAQEGPWGSLGAVTGDFLCVCFTDYNDMTELFSFSFSPLSSQHICGDKRAETRPYGTVDKFHIGPMLITHSGLSVSDVDDQCAWDRKAQRKWTHLRLNVPYSVKILLPVPGSIYQGV